MNNHIVCMFCCAVLCYKNQFIGAYFCTQMAGLHPALSHLLCLGASMSLFLIGSKLMGSLCLKFISNEFSTSPQGLVKPNYTVICRSMRPLEFMNHSSQIWK